MQLQKDQLNGSDSQESVSEASKNNNENEFWEDEVKKNVNKPREGDFQEDFSKRNFSFKAMVGSTIPTNMSPINQASKV